MTTRRKIILGASAATAAGLTTAAYRVAPPFWHQFFRDFSRPVAKPPQIPKPKEWPDTGLHAAWLGHATVLMKIDGFTVITDPVFSKRAGLHFGLVSLGIKRLTEPALAIRDLPRIDLILLSHAHMDHIDTPSLRGLESKGTKVVTAWETSDLLRPNNYRSVTELRWGQSHNCGPLQLRAIEVNHWGARYRSDTYRGYNGYVIDAGKHRVLFAGDTADTDLFRQIRTQRGIDLAIFPIGAYNPWIRYHCNPEQAWRMVNDARAERFFPVHHQTFPLGREPVKEPLDRFLTAAGRSQDRVAIRQIGQEFHSLLSG